MKEPTFQYRVTFDYDGTGKEELDFTNPIVTLAVIDTDEFDAQAQAVFFLETLIKPEYHDNFRLLHTEKVILDV